MNDDLWFHLRKTAEKHAARFVECAGRIYFVEKHYYPTGPSPLWTIDEIFPVKAEPLREDANDPRT